MEITTRKSQFAQQIKMKWYLWFHNYSHSGLWNDIYGFITIHILAYPVEWNMKYLLSVCKDGIG